VYSSSDHFYNALRLSVSMIVSAVPLLSEQPGSQFSQSRRLALQPADFGIDDSREGGFGDFPAKPGNSCLRCSVDASLPSEFQPTPRLVSRCRERRMAKRLEIVVGSQTAKSGG
jgi:hypothetical protein